MTEEVLNQRIARAQQLMNDPHFNALVESKASSYSGSLSKGGNGGLSSLEAQAGFSAPSTNRTIAEDIKVNSNEKIMPTFVNNNSSAYIPSAVKRDLIGEQQPSYSQQQYTAPQQHGGIDYSIIKAIVNECIKENLKESLNESTVRGFKVANGNKIQFVDTKGNLYEGTLTLKKKASK